MKSLIFAIVLMMGLASCGGRSEQVTETADTVEVVTDSVATDSVVADTVVADTVAVDSVL